MSAESEQAQDKGDLCFADQRRRYMGIYVVLYVSRSCDLRQCTEQPLTFFTASRMVLTLRLLLEAT